MAAANDVQRHKARRQALEQLDAAAHVPEKPIPGGWAFAVWFGFACLGGALSGRGTVGTVIGAAIALLATAGLIWSMFLNDAWRRARDERRANYLSGSQVESRK